MRKINRILILGAGGSLGTKVSSLLCSKDYYIVGVDVEENNLAHLSRLYGIPTYLEDIQDTRSLINIISEHDIELVLNTAAMKHVRSCETNIEDAININILANLNLIRYLHTEHKKFVYISSDKAIKPCNVYALSKQFTDYICRKYNFKLVRGVNFLNSRGSVLDIWEHQRLVHKPFSLVREPCRRYFVTLGQMTSLVKQTIDDDNGPAEYNPNLVYEISIHDLFSSYLQHKGLPPDVPISHFDMPGNEKIQEDLNFSPKIIRLTASELQILMNLVLQEDYLYSNNDETLWHEKTFVR